MIQITQRWKEGQGLWVELMLINNVSFNIKYIFIAL